MLGPNGAGKTTSIRIMLDIFKPDSGEVAIFGGAMNEDKKALIGYMPEERGLYQDAPLERVLRYLAALKGLRGKEANARLREYLERFDLYEHRKKKVKELSKGMQQKAQIIATIAHHPKLLVVDEPFSGLDPVNTQMVKELMDELRAQGTAIIMSTHMMHQVEALCDRLLLIDHGNVMLYGTLEEIRRPFMGNTVLIQSPANLPEIPGVTATHQKNGTWRLTLGEEHTPQTVLQSLVEAGIPLDRFEVAAPSLDEIFIRVVTRNREAESV
ncbi:MAG: ATP-binding cassette domain-containing protein [Anaerolineae bacterium]|nr:MAG: ATP-binding cassette domain-containing protein [Anaerolineae bacterium]